MASPDLVQYHQLILFDRDPLGLVERALVDAAVKFPEWVPRAGNTEVVLLDGLALEVAELVYAINRVPDAIVDVLARLFGVTRDLGAPAHATVTFTVADNLGHVIGAGARVRLAVPGLEPVDFTTDESLTVLPGDLEGTVAATATTNTSAVNGTIAATALEVLDPIVYVERARLATAVADGADPEDEVAWRNRFVTRQSRLSSTLVLPEHFTAAALEDPAVERATTIDLFDGVGAPGADTGHVTVAVLGDGGVPLSAGAKTDLEASLEALALASIDVHVVDPTITAVDVSVTVERLPGTVAADVAAAVNAAVLAYLNPEAWAWSATVYVNELEFVIRSVTGVARVVTLTTPAADVALAGSAPLADAGTVAVTVVDPT